MTTIERTMPITTASPTKLNKQDSAWVVEVLGADELRLAEAKRLEPYGRAKLGNFTKLVMWTMRFYVLFSLILIAAQLYISLHAH